jgi:hypothetical protein
MSPDEPLALEPARGLSPLMTKVAIGAGAFVAGVAGTAGLLSLNGPTPKPAPAPVVAAQPQAAPAPALPPATDVATLSAREAMLAGRLDQIELRLRDADNGARTAASYASQAERLLIAAAARRAIERGMPLGPIAPQLRRRFGEAHPDAVGTIIQAAGQPVTLEDLRLALDTIAPRLTSAPDAGIWARMTGGLGDLVVLRQSDSPSPRPADRLRRARRTLEEGQVEAALAEVARMPGAAAAESWLSAAKGYINARAALREIEAAAMEASPAAPPAPAGT